MHLWLQYITELLEPVKAIHAHRPEDFDRFCVFECILEWLVLGTAIIRGKPKIVALEVELRELRSKITDHSVNMKPLETAVGHGVPALPLAVCHSLYPLDS